MAAVLARLEGQRPPARRAGSAQGLHRDPAAAAWGGVDPPPPPRRGSGQTPPPAPDSDRLRPRPPTPTDSGPGPRPAAPPPACATRALEPSRPLPSTAHPARTPRRPGLTLLARDPTLGAGWSPDLDRDLTPTHRGPRAPPPAPGPCRAAYRSRAALLSRPPCGSSPHRTGRTGAAGRGGRTGPGRGGRAARGMPGSVVPRAVCLLLPRAWPEPADYGSRGAARERPRTSLPRRPRARSPAPPRPAPGALIRGLLCRLRGTGSSLRSATRVETRPKILWPQPPVSKKKRPRGGFACSDTEPSKLLKKAVMVPARSSVRVPNGDHVATSSTPRPGGWGPGRRGRGRPGERGPGKGQGPRLVGGGGPQDSLSSRCLVWPLRSAHLRSELVPGRGRLAQTW